MKGIYLASFVAFHPRFDIVYQDINGKRDIAGDMLEVDLSGYDFIIASPPCNYYSRANTRRDTSIYALKTRHLLPGILDKLKSIDTPWIVENVRNRPLFMKLGLYSYPCFIYEIGRHTYWSNIMFNPYVVQYRETVKMVAASKRQGGLNVFNVIESFLDSCKEITND